MNIFVDGLLRADLHWQPDKKVNPHTSFVARGGLAG
jgi:hypothetical protein